jgi:hypothetical protein
MKNYRQLAFAFILLMWVAIIGSQLHGCGTAEPDEYEYAPVVDIQCDEAACTILVHYADTITVWRDGEFYWYEDVIPPGRRYTNRDEAPEVSLTVEACNEGNCTERTLVVIEIL